MTRTYGITRTQLADDSENQFPSDHTQTCVYCIIVYVDSYITYINIPSRSAIWKPLLETTNKHHVFLLGEHCSPTWHQHQQTKSPQLLVACVVRRPLHDAWIPYVCDCDLMIYEQKNWNLPIEIARNWMSRPVSSLCTWSKLTWVELSCCTTASDSSSRAELADKHHRI